MSPNSSAPASLYSFDVFDTCVTRTYAYPRDLFYDLGLQLAPPGLPPSSTHRFAVDFQKRRIRAEKRAHRSALPRQSPTIHQIYENFVPPAGLAAGAGDLVAAEIRLEEKSIFPIPGVIKWIDELRQAGKRVVFISDMYLPAKVLAPILLRLGVMREGDKLYVSCDEGCSKHSGSLFRLVARAENIEPSAWIHIGDNPHADIRMAANAGIATSHLVAGTLTRHEARIAGRRHPRHQGKSFLAALSRRFRLSAEQTRPADTGQLDDLIFGVVLPLLLAYVAWILDHARERGIRRLYFAARDGEILYRIAQALQRDGQPIELRYLYGSRWAWLPPSVTPATAEWQRMFVVPGQARSRDDITARMRLERGEREVVRKLLRLTSEEWSFPLTYQQAHTFLQELLSNNAAARVVANSIELKRSEALAYFKQEGLFDDVSWALVDVGWRLSNQAALKRILEASGCKHHEPQGYYLALAQDCLDQTRAGAAFPFVPEAGSLFSRRVHIIEHCFVPSTHVTTRGYRIEGHLVTPLFGEELRGTNELAYVARLHDAAVSAAKLVAAEGGLAASLSAHAIEAISVAERFLRHPSRADARAMAMFGVVADMRHERSLVEPLCRPLTLKDVGTVLAMSFSKRKNFESGAFMWLEGSVTLSPLTVRIPMKIMFWLDSVRYRRRKVESSSRPVAKV